jgi:hypothetical protein
VTARIISFPRRGRNADAIRVERVEGDWLVTRGSQAWPHSSRDEALREATAIANLIRVPVVVQPENSPC